MIRLLLAIAAGGALGAVGRAGVTVWLHRIAPGAFPWGTLTVNIIGSLFLGVVVRVMHGAPLDAPLRAFLTIGVAGGFTTFSAFTYESMLLLQSREYIRAFAYMSGSVILGLAAIVLGFALGGLLSRP